MKSFMRDKLIIIGSGGHSRVVIDCAKLNNYDIAGIIDLNFQNPDQLEFIGSIPVIGNIGELEKFDSSSIKVFIAIGDNNLRKETYNILKAKGYIIPTLIHPSANISRLNTKIGSGSLINVGAIINSFSEIGDGCIINSGAIIEHENLIGDFTHVAPGSKIAGRCKIGNQTFIGLGSNIVESISIGNSVTVGAGSVITKDISNNQKIVGVNKIIG